MMSRRIAHGRQPAQIMALFALALVGMVALVALVLDGGNIYLQRRTGQASADAAALAGTRALRDATLSTSVSTIASAVSTYATANAFGTTPTVQCAVFIGTDDSVVGGVVNGGGAGCPSVSSSIPTTAAGVKVDVNIAFRPFLIGMLSSVCGSFCSSPNAAAHASAKVGVLTGYDDRNAPFIACGGVPGSGNAMWLQTITPAVATSTAVPHSLAATPASLPNFNPGPSDAVNDRLLVTPAAGTPTPPAYVADGTKDGRVYELTGPHVSNGTGGDCNASGFHGAAYSTQPTPFVQDTTSTTAVMWGDSGSSPPNITQQVAASGGCQSGPPPQVGGDPGCVMILPIASSGTGAGTPKVLDVGAWGAFYVWCLHSTGSGCQVYAGQFLSDWPISGGVAVNTWSFGMSGGPTVIHLTQ